MTAEDTTGPKLVAVLAVGQKLVRLSFDQSVAVTDQTGFVIEPLAFPAVTPLVVETSAKGQLVDLVLNTEMTPFADYQVKVTGVLDANGVPVDTAHDSATFKGFAPARPANRRFDLWSMLPVWNRREDVTGDLRRFIDCVQEVLDLLLAEVDRFPDIFDLERAPESFLNLILSDLGNPFSFDLNELSKRRLASVLVEMYRQKGTAIGIKNAIRFFLGIDVTAVSAYADTALVLGKSELSTNWELGPSDRFGCYGFDVEVDVFLTDAERSQIRAIVEYLKPGHTHFVNLVEPFVPTEHEHWELGISDLNINTDLHF